MPSSKDKLQLDFDRRLKEALDDPDHVEIFVKSINPSDSKEVQEALSNGVKNIIMKKKSLFGKVKIVGMCGVLN